jgi:hypothetical protein
MFGGVTRERARTSVTATPSETFPMEWGSPAWPFRHAKGNIRSLEARHVERIFEPKRPSASRRTTLGQFMGVSRLLYFTGIHGVDVGCSHYS